MKKQIMLLAIALGGVFSVQAQEKQDALSQSKQTTITQTRRVTDWSEQPIGYVYGGIGVGHLVDTEEGTTSTGLDWRVGMSRYYNRWGWGVVLQQFTAWQDTYIPNGMQMIKIANTGRILYLAPQFTGRWVLGEKLTIYGAIGWGWLHYRESANVKDYGQFNLKANTMGGNFSVGLEYRLGKRVGLSVDAGMVGGEIGKPKADNAVIQETIDETYAGKMDVSRLYATVGAHIYIWKH